jgi:hypothetical protein
MLLAVASQKRARLQPHASAQSIGRGPASKSSLHRDPLAIYHLNKAELPAMLRLLHAAARWGRTTRYLHSDLFTGGNVNDIAASDRRIRLDGHVHS